MSRTCRSYTDNHCQHHNLGQNMIMIKVLLNLPAAGAQSPGSGAAELLQPGLATSGVSHHLGEAGALEDPGRELIRGRGPEVRQLRLGDRGQDWHPNDS